jgi:hypothetical protein
MGVDARGCEVALRIHHDFAILAAAVNLCRLAVLATSSIHAPRTAQYAAAKTS